MTIPKVNVAVDIVLGSRSLVRASATAVTPYTAKLIITRALRDAAESLTQCGDTVEPRDDGVNPFTVQIVVKKYRKI